jgi:hypothetical protein
MERGRLGARFCVVAPESAVERIQAIAAEHGIDAWALGIVVPDERKRVWLRPVGLVGEGEAFLPT